MSSKYAKFANYLSAVDDFAACIGALIDQLCFDVDIDDEAAHSLLCLLTDDVGRRKAALSVIRANAMSATNISTGKGALFRLKSSKNDKFTNELRY